MEKAAEQVKEEALEYIWMFQNGLSDGEYSKAHYIKHTQFNYIFDHVINSVPYEARFLGKDKLVRLIEEAREEEGLT